MSALLRLHDFLLLLTLKANLEDPKPSADFREEPEQERAIIRACISIIRCLLMEGAKVPCHVNSENQLNGRASLNQNSRNINVEK